VLFGFGIPEFVKGTGLGATLALYSITATAATKRISEITKSVMAPPSI
jgi:hypothetical protein